MKSIQYSDNDFPREVLCSIRRSLMLADAAGESLKANCSVLVTVIRSGGGQGRRVEELLWSAWNGDYKTGLCDSLTGLDSAIAEAVIAMLAARAHMGGDADDLLRKIIEDSGSQPPRKIEE
jgi:hypothetical protein